MVQVNCLGLWCHPTVECGFNTKHPGEQHTKDLLLIMKVGKLPFHTEIHMMENYIVFVITQMDVISISQYRGEKERSQMGIKF